MRPKNNLLDGVGSDDGSWRLGISCCRAGAEEVVFEACRLLRYRKICRAIRDRTADDRVAARNRNNGKGNGRAVVVIEGLTNRLHQKGEAIRSLNEGPVSN
ncbi:hypothetical protein [Martelella soudanensis]|uniref:hypothetical protein n=1 Tax=unclassified Martelella TaxID=2629616 RepID=UPI0015DFD446|nr:MULTISPECIES: hypothetical protein [unclassified Martelella]